MLRKSREAVFLLDASRRLVFVNPAWERLTGRTAEAVMGLECRPHGPNRDGDLDGLGGSFCPPPEALAGRPSGVKTLVVQPGGERLWCRVEYWPYHNARGGLIGIVGAVRTSDEPAHVPDSEALRLRAELAEIRERLRERHGDEALIGRGPTHRRLLGQVAAAAASDVAVLLVGDPGTGKRTVARVIHQRSAHSTAPLVAFDVAALPPEVLERELFGGSPERTSRLGLPDGSTVLLGDVLELPRDLQARLADALEERRIRLIATTACDPDAALAADRLRPDLYYTLTGLVLRLNPLRERLDELPLLAQHLLERANLRSERSRLGFSTEALEVLAAYDWPGNLRELARVIDMAQASGEADLIAAADLPAAVLGQLASAYTPPRMPPPITPLDETLTQLERRLIEGALQRARQNKSRAADLLAISRPRLYRRIKELGIAEEPEPADDAAHAAPTA